MGAEHQLSPAAAQVRPHMGHSHSHGHSHDNTYLTSKNKNDPGVRITRIGLCVNLGMAITKGTGGWLFNSKALTADAVHSLTDLISDLTTLATLSYSLRPPTTRFPAGYGKIESLGALAVSGILLAGGIAIGLQALLALAQYFAPDVAHVLSHIPGFGGHHHDHGVKSLVEEEGYTGPNINGAWLALGSIVIKEWLYRATLKVANAKQSSVLASNAYHHRVDSLTAFVALVVISASNVWTNAPWFDAVGGLVISGMIVQAGWGNTKLSFLELADKGVDEEMRGKVERAATKAIEARGFGVGKEAVVRNVQGIKSGQNFLMDVEIAVPRTWALDSMIEVENAVRAEVGKSVRGVKRVKVRFVTQEQEIGFADEFVGLGEPGTLEEQGHDHDHDNGHSHTNANGHHNGETKR
ncbi:mitochondrial metal transporter [Elasticomyces elasticus]|nr:mitochondrial metal transporter [Elasticomyces elasticus]